MAPKGNRITQCHNRPGRPAIIFNKCFYRYFDTWHPTHVPTFQLLRSPWDQRHSGGPLYPQG